MKLDCFSSLSSSAYITPKFLSEAGFPFTCLPRAHPVLSMKFFIDTNHIRFPSGVAKVFFSFSQEKAVAPSGSFPIVLSSQFPNCQVLSSSFLLVQYPEQCLKTLNHFFLPVIKNTFQDLFEST